MAMSLETRMFQVQETTTWQIKVPLYLIFTSQETLVAGNLGQVFTLWRGWIDPVTYIRGDARNTSPVSLITMGLF